MTRPTCTKKVYILNTVNHVQYELIYTKYTKLTKNNNSTCTQDYQSEYIMYM